MLRLNFVCSVLLAPWCACSLAGKFAVTYEQLDGLGHALPLCVLEASVHIAGATACAGGFVAESSLFLKGSVEAHTSNAGFARWCAGPWGIACLSVFSRALACQDLHMLETV
jgi:hypothetical protein